MKYTSRVVTHRKMGADVRLLTLDAPEAAEKARPGRFIMLRVNQGPEPVLPRPFSIHNAEGGSLTVLYRVVGRGTKILARVEPGDALPLWGPLGNGFDLSLENPLLVAGGMGIAPMAFAAKALAGRSVRYQALWGVGEKNALCGAEITAGGSCRMAGADWQVVSEDGSVGRKGLVTAPLAEILAAAEIKPTVLACGPSPMLKAVAGLCLEHGAECRLSLEAPMACGLGACLGCVTPAAGGGYHRVCKEGPVLNARDIDWKRFV